MCTNDTLSEMRSNNSLERTVASRGRPVRAMALLRGPVRSEDRWPAVHLNR
jgi:hypothetical protein